MSHFTQIIISCASAKQAEKIGSSLLKKRLIACYDVFPRLTTKYYWPPNTGKTKTNKGVVLMAPTILKHLKKITALVKQLHSDKVPFIGSFKIKSENPDYYLWLINEINHN